MAWNISRPLEVHCVFNKTEYSINVLRSSASLLCSFNMSCHRKSEVSVPCNFRFWSLRKLGTFYVLDIKELGYWFHFLFLHIFENRLVTAGRLIDKEMIWNLRDNSNPSALLNKRMYVSSFSFIYLRSLPNKLMSNLLHVPGANWFKYSLNSVLNFFRFLKFSVSFLWKWLFTNFSFDYANFSSANA